MNEIGSKSSVRGKSGRVMARRVVLALFGVVVLVGMVWAFLPKPVPVEVAATVQGPLDVVIEEDGKTRVIDRYIVSAPVGGRIPRIHLRPGDPIGVGDLLVAIEPIAAPLMDARTRAQNEGRLKAAQAAVRQADAAVKRAQASHRFAVEDLGKAEELRKTGVASKRDFDLAELDEKTRAQELESARFSAQVARFELETAKVTLERMDRGEPAEGEQIEVRSPVAGRVLRVVQAQEGVIAPGAELIEVADPKALEVVADVLTTDAVHVQHGNPVEIVQWGGGTALRGAVRIVEPSAFTRTSALGVDEQRVNVIIDFLPGQFDPEGEPAAEEDHASLGDGYRVEVRIHVWQGDVLKVPVSALFREGEAWAVFVVEDGLASLRTVELGRRQGLEAEVRSGLEVDESVIVHPADTVVDGRAVEVAGET